MINFTCSLCGDLRTSANPHKECTRILQAERKVSKKKKPSRKLSDRECESAGKFFTKYD